MVNRFRFGFASICSTIVLGDESGYSIGLAQQTKMAAIEAMWETEPAPASFNLIADINQAEQKNNWAVQIPYVMGLIGTRSLDTRTSRSWQTGTDVPQPAAGALPLTDAAGKSNSPLRGVSG